MSLLIVADTGPLVILAKLNRLALLRQLYAEIRIPETVLIEATSLAYRQDTQRIVAFAAQYAQVMPDIAEDNPDYLDYGLDAGETQAILWAKRTNCPVLLDERRGRIIAKQEHLAVLGTVGLLLKAKHAGLIPEISSLLDSMLAHDYRLAPALIQQARTLAGES